MEVCEESIHALNFLPGVDVDVCIAIKGCDSDAIRGIAGSGFQRAQAGGADSDDASSTGIDFVCGFLGHMDVFRVHRVFGDVIRALDRPEGPETNG